MEVQLHHFSRISPRLVILVRKTSYAKNDKTIKRHSDGDKALGGSIVLSTYARTHNVGSGPTYMESATLDQ